MTGRLSIAVMMAGLHGLRQKRRAASAVPNMTGTQPGDQPEKPDHALKRRGRSPDFGATPGLPWCTRPK